MGGELMNMEGDIMDNELNEDVCGFCGQPGADKIPHPIRWPGERSAGTECVHAECEAEECRRAHAALTDCERKQILRTL